MLMRSTCGVICASDSLDGGQAWTPIRRTSLLNNNSGIDVARSPGGMLLLACNPVAARRSPLSLMASVDNGASWDRVYDLEIGPGEYSYPSVVAISLKDSPGSIPGSANVSRSGRAAPEGDPVQLRRSQMAGG